jgi:hypothetical protein
MKSDFLTKLKSLKEFTIKLEKDLESLGLSSTNGETGMALNQFFNHNIKNIILACQALVRGDHGEGASLRLKRELPSALKNLASIAGSGQGRRLGNDISEIKLTIEYIQDNYEDL